MHIDIATSGTSEVSFLIVCAELEPLSQVFNATVHMQAHSLHIKSNNRI